MEYRKKCNVCGKIFCYNDSDVNENKTNAVLSALSGLAGVSAALNGNAFQRIEANQHMQMNDTSKLKDFNKCPYCGSTNLKLLTDDDIKQFEIEEAARNLQISGVVDPVALLKRSYIFLEDGNFPMAAAYAENALNGDPENALGYLYKLLAELKLNKKEDLSKQNEDFDKYDNYKKAYRFADDELRNELDGYIRIIKDRKDYEFKNCEYNSLVSQFNSANSSSTFYYLEQSFRKLNDFKDSQTYENACSLKGKEFKIKEIEEENNKNYNRALSLSNSNKSIDIEQAIEILNSIGDYKDSKQKALDLKNSLINIKDKEIRKEKNKKKAVITITIIGIIFTIIALVYSFVISPKIIYNKALKLYNSNEYEDAINLLNNRSDIKSVE